MQVISQILMQGMWQILEDMLTQNLILKQDLENIFLCCVIFFIKLFLLKFFINFFVCQDFLNFWFFKNSVKFFLNFCAKLLQNIKN